MDKRGVVGWTLGRRCYRVRMTDGRDGPLEAVVG